MQIKSIFFFFFFLSSSSFFIIFVLSTKYFYIYIYIKFKNKENISINNTIYVLLCFFSSYATYSQKFRVFVSLFSSFSIYIFLCFLCMHTYLSMHKFPDILFYASCFSSVDALYIDPYVNKNNEILFLYTSRNFQFFCIQKHTIYNLITPLIINH